MRRYRLGIVGLLALLALLPGGREATAWNEDDGIYLGGRLEKWYDARKRLDGLWRRLEERRAELELQEHASGCKPGLALFEQQLAELHALDPASPRLQILEDRIGKMKGIRC